MALTVFAAFLSYTCGGCLSHEHVIPPAELARLTQIPPEQRGQAVHVVQEIGSRRSDAIDPTQPPPPAAPPPEGYPGGPYGPPPEGYVQAAPEPQTHVSVGVIIAPPILPPPAYRGSGSVAAGPRGPIGGSRSGVAPRATPSRTPRSSSKGGGGGKDDLIAFAVAVAVMATVGMVATEGARFDGVVAMDPWQPVHLRDPSGQERQIPLAQLTPADVATSSEALVMDDEGWGMVRLGRRPLDRKGLAFKLNLGLFQSMCTSCLSGDGAAMNVQLGYFPHHRVGVLGSWTIAGGSDSTNKSFYRNDLSVEAQVFPLHVWRLHLGGFGHAGVQYADDEAGGNRSGAAVGGGLLLEIDLTTRLALTVRGDYTAANVGPAGNAWAGSGTLTFGVAVY